MIFFFIANSNCYNVFAKVEKNYEISTMNEEIFSYLCKINAKTMKKALLFIALAGLMTACGSKKTSEANQVDDAISMHENLPGDSALYGLACDGCTDSILVFLPYSGGDPDTFDIINARLEHRVFGRPHIGDPLAVILNPENRTEALTVINMGTLEGQWCYMVEPTLRTLDGKMPPLPDSIRKKIMAPVEYSLKLKTDNSASAMGYMRKDGRRPSIAVYPTIHRYTDWHLYNGRLILHADTLAGFTQKGDEPITDTADIVMLMHDSLILRIGDKEQHYYRKRPKK